ncbi:E4-ORFD [Bat mastadenovirus A]|uniref:E4-ORFD n=1 Tax=Bat mastadenovirus A TaxID=1146877 RepID=A0A3G9EY31_9ADEN|nr:E4-ORFD [Bat mastadenovirus A]
MYYRFALMAAQTRTPCVRGTLTFFEDFVRQITSYVDDPHSFLFELLSDVTGFHFDNVFIKSTARDKPGITFKFVFHNSEPVDRDSALSRIKVLLVSELYAALQADEHLKFDFGGKDLFSVSMSETYSFCS